MFIFNQPPNKHLTVIQQRKNDSMYPKTTKPFKPSYAQPVAGLTIWIDNIV